ncbi:MAG TPA: xanthine dehydrogenase family protein subunit M [Pyrinomonadaceae bacterium]|nr:xanthine dehydrogenase family protein subunit M [Pyrinomonadaceae bacterium]
MNNFSYARAIDVSDAVSEISADNRAKFIAGGTNILDLMKENVSHPSKLVDINRLPLNTIEDNENGGLRLGSLCTNAETAYHEQVERRYPLLSKAILAGASLQLRNMATNGGNLLQRTRCYYFYDVATPCNKREPNSGCSAIDGFNRMHAIFGTSENCIATYPGDMANALAALEAVVNVEGENGKRRIKFEDFHRLPGDTPQLDTNLRGDEIITSIDLPEKGFALNHAYLKLRDRTSYAFALVAVAVGLEMDGDSIKEVRLVLGGAAHKPWRNREAENLLTGKTATKENFQATAEMVFREAKGFEHNAFKIELGRRAVVRALRQAVEMKRESDTQFHRTSTEPI